MAGQAGQAEQADVRGETARIFTQKYFRSSNGAILREAADVSDEYIAPLFRIKIARESRMRPEGTNTNKAETNQ
jgi:hypothetical protein